MAKQNLYLDTYKRSSTQSQPFESQMKLGNILGLFWGINSELIEMVKNIYNS
jgi:hypothetical protein